MGDYYSKLGYSADEPSSDIRYIVNQNRDKKDWVGAAFDEAMSPMAIKRIWERKSRDFTSEPDWEIDEQTENEIQRDYSKTEEEYLKKAESKAEFIARKKDIKDDRDRESLIAESGAKGILGTLAFSLIDPIGIGLGVVSGGIGWGSEMTGMAKMMRVATSVGLENAAIASALTAGNTESDATDIISAFGTGALIGAGLSPFIRAKKPKLTAEADAADAAAHMDSEAIIMDDAVNKVRDNIKINENLVDERLVKAKLNEYEESLKVQEKPLNKGQTNKIKAEIKEIEDLIEEESEGIRTAQEELKDTREKISEREKEHIENVSKKRVEIEEEYAGRIAKQEQIIDDIDKTLTGRKNETKKAIRLWEEEEKLNAIKAERDKKIKVFEEKSKTRVKQAKADFSTKLNEKIKGNKKNIKILKQQLEESNNKLKSSSDIKNKQNMLRKFQQMQYEEQVQHVFGDKELPTKKAELDRQLKGIKESVSESAPEEPLTPPEEPLSATGTDSTVHEPKAAEEGSAGAMKAGEKPDHPFYEQGMDQKRTVAMFAHDGAEMPDDLRGRLFLGARNWFTEKLYAAQTFISNSKDYAIRGFGYHLFEAPQGGTAAKVTVGARVRNYTQQIRSAMRNRMNEGIDEWAKEQGMSRLSALKGANREKYYKMVMQEIKHPGMYDSEAVRKGAAGVKDQLAMAGKIRSEAGEAGFENLDIYKNYVPVVINPLKIKYAVLEHGMDKVKAVLSKAYQEGHFKLNPELADRVAEGYIKRAQDHTLTIAEHIRRTSDKDVEELAKALKKAGVDDETITDFLETNMQKETRQYMSDRAKKSLYPSIESEMNGLKMIDLIESDLPKLTEAYTRDAAGGAAFAKLGFKTKMQVMDCLAEIEKAAINNGMSHTEVAREMQILRDGVTLAYGRSLNENAYSPFVRNLSRIRAMTSMVMLQYFGLASIPELARSLTQRGLKDTLSACKNLGAFGTKTLRKGGKYSGLFNKADLRELENILGYQGEDFVLYPKHLRLGNIEETEEGSRIGKYIDNALANGQRIQEVLSGFRLVQGSGEKLAARTLGSHIKKWALEGAEALSEADIKRAGWADGFLDDLKAWMLKNPATDTFNGKEIKLFNFGKMPADMQERLQIGMHRLLAGEMQRNLLGENPMSMHRWLGQTLMQFRNFSMLSLEKQLVYDIRQQPLTGSLIFLNSLFLSYLTLAAQTLHVGLGKDNQDEYIQKHLASKATPFYVLSKMGQLASLQTGADLMATFGLLPDSMMGTTYSPGGRTLTSGTIPAVGMVNDTLKSSRDLVDTILGQKDDSDLMKQLRRVVPFAKTIGINQALNVIEKDLKD